MAEDWIEGSDEVCGGGFELATKRNKPYDEVRFLIGHGERLDHCRGAVQISKGSDVI